MPCRRSELETRLARSLGSQSSQLQVPYGLLPTIGLAAVATTCSGFPEPPQDPGGLSATALEGTVEVLVEETMSALAATATPSVAPTTAPTATTAPTETATPAPVLIGVSANTNCRTGPSAGYDYRGTMLVGETTIAHARSTVENYLYIANPDRPGEYCWLWDEYATVEGELSILPIYTPLPSPIPVPAITMGFDHILDCGSSLAVFRVHNTGRYTFMTANRHIVDLDTGKELYESTIDRHPFAPNGHTCPPGHENELYPDQVAYIHVPLKSAPAGHTARATLLVCTEDYIRGDCFVNRIDFRIP